MDQRKACVIGAGIVGVCSALWLQREGFDVTVVDAGPIGEGASFGNAGNISPGSVVPHLIPELWKELPGWMLDAQGPLTVRPAHVLKALPWLLAAARASRRERVLEVSRAMLALHGNALQAYETLTHGTQAARLIERCGQLYVSEHPTAAHGSALVQMLRSSAGVRSEALDWMEVRELEPSLAPIFRSGLLLPDNARTRDPHALVKALAGEATRNGATFVRGKVTGFDRSAGQVRAVLIEGRPQPVENVVIAAGAASGQLSAWLGTRVPLAAERGYHITISDAGVAPRIPVMHCDARFVASPMDVGLRLAGTAEFAALDAAPNWRRTQVLENQARRMFPGVRVEKVSRWMGSRPSLPDGLPVLGRAPGCRNAWFAFGNSHFGMTAGPTMGRLVAELLAGRQTSIDVAPYAAERFAR